MRNDEAFYFEHTENGHNKFWAVSVELGNKEKHGECTLTRRYGKIGQEGRVMTEKFLSYYSALERKRKLINEKITKGYVAVM